MDDEIQMKTHIYIDNTNTLWFLGRGKPSQGKESQDIQDWRGGYMIKYFYVILIKSLHQILNLSQNENWTLGWI